MSYENFPTISGSKDDKLDGYFDLGSYSRPVRTASKAAQSWFDRGLVWSYAFNHEEAARCFERASNADPQCVMALWGLAYALGPNYNKPWEFFDEDERKAILQQANAAVLTAEQLATFPVEIALIKSLKCRYPTSTEVDPTNLKSFNESYAEAMQGVYREFGDDLDVATLYADALMNITPWGLWDLRTGEPSEGARTLEAKDVLDRALAQPGGQGHPGALHLYIHLMEMSANPEAALPVADRLRGLVPDGGHLHHMPTHLDVLCGDWQRAITSNTDAIDADERYVARAGALNFYTLYRSHNYHFRVYAAMFSGKYKTALDTVKSVEASLTDELLRITSPPMADWLESFLSMRMHVLVRFGQWDAILDLRVPEDQSLYCVTTAMTHYAKGVAFAAIGKFREGDEERKLFHQAMVKVPQTRTLFNNTAIDILAVAAAMLDGELEYCGGDFKTAFEHLRKAIELSDSLPYDEPWGWMQPPRHAYGALLLEQNHVEDAAAVYEADLGIDDTLPRALRHPNNVWALHGLHECLVRLNRVDDAEVVKMRLDICEKDTDVPVTSSCFCRRAVVEARKT